MHYEVDYSNMAPEAAEAKALKDCEMWLGRKAKLRKVIRCLEAFSGTCNIDMAYVTLSFVGIHGFPATVLIERHFTPQMSFDFQ